MRSLCFVYISGVQSLNVTLYSFLSNFFVQTSFVIEFSTEVSCQCSEDLGFSSEGCIACPSQLLCPCSRGGALQTVASLSLFSVSELQNQIVGSIKCLLV